jgi:NADH:ubiquinone oxidoreductase subunit E
MDIIEMARQARFFVSDNEVYSPSNQADHELTEFLEHFAYLVAAQEREAAITAIQNIERKGGWVTREDAINAIKARGTT